jgi:hypothetical protein
MGRTEQPLEYVDSVPHLDADNLRFAFVYDLESPQVVAGIAVVTNDGEELTRFTLSKEAVSKLVFFFAQNIETLGLDK